MRRKQPDWTVSFCMVFKFEEIMTEVSWLAELSKEAVCNEVLCCSSDITKDCPSKGIHRIDQPISYKEFFRLFLQENRPCMLGSFATQTWKSREEWVKSDGLPDFDFLKNQFGHVTVPVAICAEVEYNAQPKQDMLFRDYLQYWEEYIRKDYSSEKGCLYMKDMHFTREFPLYKAYETPVYFTSDWLNEYWDSGNDGKEDDYRFVYMGPKGSWTPFHADVFRSYSWSANICGTKKWILVPPGQEVLLQDRLGNLPYDVHSCDFKDSEKYPKFKEELYTPVEVVQYPGEVIFVPSGWHHQVYNMVDTISVNHNWFNGVSIYKTWVFLQEEFSRVQESISDCREMDGWENQCQLILKSLSGIDFKEFFVLLNIIAKRRLNVIKTFEEAVESDLYGNNITFSRQQCCCQSGDSLVDRLCPGGDCKKNNDQYGYCHWKRSLTFWHVLYDLKQLMAILSLLMENADCKTLEVCYKGVTPLILWNEVSKTVLRHLPS